MTNPNNAVGTNGAFGGRTSVNAFNDVMGAFQNSGVLSGWGIVPSSGMTVSCGGIGTVRDVAIAEDTNGNKTSVNNISGSAIDVTLDTAPASNSRYDAIVVYVDKPPMGSGTQDNPECCGIIPVTGTAASTPSYPDDNAIRSAITADGASGATAYYAVIGYVLVASGTTTISSGMISAGNGAAIGTNQIVDEAITTDKIDNGAVTADKIDFSTLLRVSVDGAKKSFIFSDGTLIATRNISEAVNINTSWGSLYKANTTDNWTLASTYDVDFISAPTVLISPYSNGSTSFILGMNENCAPTLPSGGRWRMPQGAWMYVRPDSRTSVNVGVSVYAFGRWK